MAVMLEGARRGYATRNKRMCNAPKQPQSEARSEIRLTRQDIHAIPWFNYSSLDL